MINIIRKEDCVGCNACVQRCPKLCISMIEDEQGFLYPKVNISKCIECGLCEKVCPVINQAESRNPIAVYAAKNKDEEVQKNSSSGGIFYALAKKIIDTGGVVFGVRFNDKWEVVHSYADTLDGLKLFQGSKYVQSQIGRSYLEAEKFLKSGRKVLFTGTPCQIAGLKRFLRKDYDNLIAVDVVCHGVPSPLVWRKYLDFITLPEGGSKNTASQSQSHHSNDIPEISGISFRDKRLGWEKFGFSVHTIGECNSKEVNKYELNKDTIEVELLNEIHTKNLYMQVFLKNLDLRPSCYICPSKSGKSNSDISLADFWRISSMYPALYDFNGMSLILTYTEKGKVLLTKLKNEINLSEVEYLHTLKANPAIVKSVKKPKEYASFWKEYQANGFTNIRKILDGIRPSLSQKVMERSIKLIKILLGNKIYNSLNHKFDKLRQ